METKPFNLDHAIAGAPVQLADGTEAKIIKFDGRNKGCPLVVLIGDLDRPHLASVSGVVSFGPMNPSRKLVMQPIGYCAGKPVFYGDELIHCNATVRVDGNILWPKTGADFGDSWGWPPVDDGYPKTQMTDAEIQAEIINRPMDNSARNTINAAIRHGIDNGYLRPSTQAEDHDFKKASERGFCLANIASICGAAPTGWFFTDVPKMVQSMADQVASLKQCIANQATIITDYKQAAVDRTEREFAIADHFYAAGLDHGHHLCAPAVTLKEFIKSELAKVKP